MGGLLFLVHVQCVLNNVYLLHQAMHAQSSVAVGLKGANKAMEAVNKVSHRLIIYVRALY
jgi:hypothetical protein